MKVKLVLTRPVTSYRLNVGGLETFGVSLRSGSNVCHSGFGLFSVFIIMTFLDFYENDFLPW